MNAGDGRGNLPGAWTELGNGATRQQVKNVLQANAVTVHFDQKPVAVLLSVESYRELYRLAYGADVEQLPVVIP